MRHFLFSNRADYLLFQAVLDYVKPATETMPAKPFYSVYVGKTNVAVFLVEVGATFYQFSILLQKWKS